jgi:hypothetical protein
MARSAARQKKREKFQNKLAQAARRPNTRPKKVKPKG